MSVKPRVNLILDSLILVAFLLTIISGFSLDAALDSVIVPAGQGASSITQMDDSIHGAGHLHIGMSITFVVLIAAHHVVHWKWITSQVAHLFGSSRQRLQAPGN